MSVYNMGETKVTSTEHADLSKAQIIGRINLVGEDMKVAIDTIQEFVSHAPLWGGPGNSKDKLSEILHELDLLHNKILELDFTLVCESKARARDESSDSDSG